MCENDIPLHEGLEAAGFKQVQPKGLPEGVTMYVGSREAQSMEDVFGPPIASYSRKQAIEDGVLVDLTADGETKQLCLEAGFKLPVAMTATAFHDTVLAGTTETPEGEFVFPGSQSCKGRLWDVLMVLRFSIRAANAHGDTDRVNFKVSVDQHGDGKHETVKLWCQIGPGDSGEPVLTVMLEGED
jgi:hypothetical protein